MAQRVRRMKVGRVPREGPAGAVGKTPATSGFGARSHEEDRRRIKPGMVALGGAATGGRSDEKRRQNWARIKLHQSG